MNKNVFLKKLEEYLKPLGKEAVVDILRDQEEFINEAISAGRAEVEVISSIGDPKKFAQNIIAESRLDRADEATTFKRQVSTTWAVLKSFAVLAPLNIFVLIGPFLLFVLLILCGWLVSLSFFTASVSMVLLFFMQLKDLMVPMSAHVAYLMFALGLSGLSQLIGVFMYHVSRIFLWGTVGYVRWNYNFVNENFKK